MGISHHKQPGLLTPHPTWPLPSWNLVVLIELTDSVFSVAFLTSPPAHSGITAPPKDAGAFPHVKEMCSGLGMAEGSHRMDALGHSYFFELSDAFLCTQHAKAFSACQPH